MKHSNKITVPLSQGKVLSLRGSEATKAKQGEATTSQTTTPSLRDSAQKHGIVAIHAFVRCHIEDKRNISFLFCLGYFALLSMTKFFVIARLDEVKSWQSIIFTSVSLGLPRSLRSLAMTK